jgi:hypothetical protein
MAGRIDVIALPGHELLGPAEAAVCGQWATGGHGHLASPSDSGPTPARSQRRHERASRVEGSTIAARAGG